ncbi:hypothetical protein ACTPEF_25325, partial [Clostridioides difficile]
MELDGLKFYPERLELELNGENLIITKKEGILIECLIKRYPKGKWIMIQHWESIEDLKSASSKMFKDSSTEKFRKALKNQTVKMN